MDSYIDLKMTEELRSECGKAYAFLEKSPLEISNTYSGYVEDVYKTIDSLLAEYWKNPAFKEEEILMSEYYRENVFITQNECVVECITRLFKKVSEAVKVYYPYYK